MSFTIHEWEHGMIDAKTQSEVISPTEQLLNTPDSEKLWFVLERVIEIIRRQNIQTSTKTLTEMVNIV